MVCISPDAILFFMSFTDSLRLLLGFLHALQFLLMLVCLVLIVEDRSKARVCRSVSVRLNSALGLCSLHEAHCLGLLSQFWSGNFMFGHLIGRGRLRLAMWISI